IQETTQAYPARVNRSKDLDRVRAAAAASLPADLVMMVWSRGRDHTRRRRAPRPRARAGGPAAAADRTDCVRTEAAGDPLRRRRWILPASPRTARGGDRIPHPLLPRAACDRARLHLRTRAPERVVTGGRDRPHPPTPAAHRERREAC